MSGTDREGEGSRARDHLANERTYLAWIRSGANVMILGLIVAQFSRGGAFAWAAGVILVAVGVAGVLYGLRRYRFVNRQIENGEYSTGTTGRAVTMAAVVLVTAVLVAFALLAVGRSV